MPFSSLEKVVELLVSDEFAGECRPCIADKNSASRTKLVHKPVEGRTIWADVRSFLPINK